MDCPECGRAPEKTTDWIAVQDREDNFTGQETRLFFHMSVPECRDEREKGPSWRAWSETRDKVMV